MLYKGEQEKLWQKGKTPSTYIIQGEKKNSQGSGSKKVSPLKRSTKPAKATKPRSRKVRNSLSLLPEYKGLQKHEAITTVLEKHRGTAVHQDTMIEMLYGQLSPEAFNAERPRTKTALLAGVKTKKWQKSRKPSCFQLPKNTKKSVKTKTTGQKTKSLKTQSKATATVAEKTPANPAKSVAAAKPKARRKTTSARAKTPARTKATPSRKRGTRGKTTAKA